MIEFEIQCAFPFSAVIVLIILLVVGTTLAFFAISLSSALVSRWWKESASGVFQSEAVRHAVSVS